MSKILKTDQGIFIPRDFIKDFEGAEVDASVPGVIMIRSKTGNRPSALAVIFSSKVGIFLSVVSSQLFVVKICNLPLTPDN